MLIFPKAKLTFLAAPKTGTTAIEEALAPHSGLAFSQNPYKHMNLGEYKRFAVPLLALDPAFDGDAYETVCVIREPMGYLESWYRYQSRLPAGKNPRSTSGISFNDYIAAVLSDNPPAFARVRRLSQFARDGSDRVTTILRYGDPGIENFFSRRLGVSVVFPRRNVSPQRDVEPLSADLEARLQDAWAEEFRLYDETTSLSLPPRPRPTLAVRWKNRTRRVYRALTET